MKQACSLTLHLLQKDTRHLIRLIAFQGLLTFLIPLETALDSGWTIGLGITPAFVLSCARYVILLMAVHQLLRLDPPLRGNHFLSTRPVSCWPLLLSKILFVLLFLVIPSVVMQELTVYAAGIQYDWTDTGLSMIETSIRISGIAALIGFFALFFRNVSTVILAITAPIIVLLFCFLVAAAFYRSSVSLYSSLIFPLFSFFFSLSFFGGRCLFLGIFVTVAALAYRLKSKWIILLGIGMVLIEGETVSIMNEDLPHPLDRIKPKLTDVTVGRTNDEILANISIPGLQEMEYVESIDCGPESVLTFGFSESSNVVRATREKLMLSMSNPRAADRNSSPVVLSLKRTALVGESTVSSPTGVIKVNVSRLRLLPFRTPLENVKPGMAVVFGRRRIVFDKSGSDIQLASLSASLGHSYSVSLELRPDSLEEWPLFALVSNPRFPGMYLCYEEVNLQITDIAIRHTLTLSSMADDRASTDQEWRAGAVVTFFETSPVGYATLPFSNIKPTGQ